MMGELQAGHSRRAEPYRLLVQLGTQTLGDGVEIEHHRWDSRGSERGSKVTPLWNSVALGRDSTPRYRKVGIPQ
jgi:hypothetical protein